MRLFGFSTGALALGDFRKGLPLLRGSAAQAVELSALREHELAPVMQALDELSLEEFGYVSVHAPSRLSSLDEKDVVRMLLPCLDHEFRVVLHPDAIQNPGGWRQFGSALCIENMDKRKSTGRTASELQRFFADLPEASLCLDLAHARQVDTTLAVARFILAEFGGERVAQVHLSELDARSHHGPLSMGAVHAIRGMAHWVPKVPVILESMVTEGGIAAELELARRCFDTEATATVSSEAPSLAAASAKAVRSA
jgi:hypothetical protein